MGKCTYAKPDTETRALLEQVMQAYHPELEQAQVRVGITMVYPPTNKDGEPTRHALTRHGARCLARIHLVSLAKRVYVPVDAMIEIDAEHWENILAPARKAILDHELTHIVVRYQKGKGVVTAGEDGTPESVRRLPKLDQDDRPMLGLKPDDYAITGKKAG